MSAIRNLGLLAAFVLALGGAVPAAAVGSFADEMLAPAGVRVGMTLEKAKAQLLAMGYQLAANSRCRFTRAMPNGDGRTIDLKFEDAGSRAHPTSKPPRFPTVEEIKRGHELALACATPGALVAGITFREAIERSAADFNEPAEVHALVQRHGAHAGCGRVGCVWWHPKSDPNIARVNVSIERTARVSEIEGDPVKLFPVLPEYASKAAAAAAEALALCKNYGIAGGFGHAFRALHDCECLAKRVGNAYARGQVRTVDASIVSGAQHALHCPAPLPRLQAVFEQTCLQYFGNEPAAVGKWARGGGCRCTGIKGAPAYLYEPDAGGGAVDYAAPAQACGYQAANSGKLEQALAEATAGLPAAPKPAHRGAEQQDIGSLPPGLRPLEMWVEDGRPLVRSWSGFSSNDVGAAADRYVNLLLIAFEPTLAEPAASQTVLAGQNLAGPHLNRIIKDCGLIQNPQYCQWAGKDEFGARAAQQEYASGFASHVAAFARSLPREIVHVEPVRLGEYDAARGGFPIIHGDPNWRFRFSDGSLPKGASLAVRREDYKDPDLLPATAAEAEAILKRLSARSLGAPSRGAVYATTYRVTGVKKPPDPQTSFPRLLAVEPLGVRLFADEGLTDLIADFGAPGSKPAAVADGAATEVSSSAAIPERPLDLPKIGARLLIEPASSSSHETGAQNRRLFNLILLGLEPSLMDDAQSAHTFAQENLIGLAAPDAAGQWVGANEFERVRSRAAFKEKGAAQVLARAVKLPIEIMIRRSGTLGEYDFTQEAFPIQIYGGDPSTSGFAPHPDLVSRNNHNVLLPGGGPGILGRGVRIRWRAEMDKPVWKVASSQAQAVLAKLPPMRSVHIGTIARLVGMSRDPQGTPWIHAEILDVSLYSNAELTDKIAVLPIPARAAAAAQELSASPTSGAVNGEGPGADSSGGAPGSTVGKGASSVDAASGGGFSWIGWWLVGLIAVLGVGAGGWFGYGLLNKRAAVARAAPADGAS